MTAFEARHHATATLIRFGSALNELRKLAEQMSQFEDAQIVKALADKADLPRVKALVSTVLTALARR
jgi:hypothetical protein